MKSKIFKSVAFDNRKRLITFVYETGKKYVAHYSDLGIHNVNIVDAWIDEETSMHSVGFSFSDGSNDYIPYSQPLFIAKDPHFMLRTHIEIITAMIKEELKKKRISKRYLAKKLNTSDNQIQRLLNPSILNKNLEQLYKIVILLNLELEIKINKAA